MYDDCELSETTAFGLEHAIWLIDPKRPMRALEILTKLGIVEQEACGHWRLTENGCARFTPAVADPDLVWELDCNPRDLFRIHM